MSTVELELQAVLKEIFLLIFIEIALWIPIEPLLVHIEQIGYGALIYAGIALVTIKFFLGYYFVLACFCRYKNKNLSDLNFENLFLAANISFFLPIMFLLVITAIAVIPSQETFREYVYSWKITLFVPFCYYAYGVSLLAVIILKLVKQLKKT